MFGGLNSSGPPRAHVGAVEDEIEMPRGGIRTAAAAMESTERVGAVEYLGKGWGCGISTNVSGWCGRARNVVIVGGFAYKLRRRHQEG